MLPARTHISAILHTQARTPTRRRPRHHHRSLARCTVALHRRLCALHASGRASQRGGRPCRRACTAMPQSTPPSVVRSPGRTVRKRTHLTSKTTSGSTGSSPGPRSHGPQNLTSRPLSTSPPVLTAAPTCAALRAARARGRPGVKRRPHRPEADQGARAACLRAAPLVALDQDAAQRVLLGQRADLVGKVGRAVPRPQRLALGLAHGKRPAPPHPTQHQPPGAART